MKDVDLQNILAVILGDSNFVRNKHEYVVKNYKRKIQKEIYQESLARKGLDYYIPDAIKVYNTLTDSNIHLDKQDKEIFKDIILKKILEDIKK
jgi:hypothetical protein